jgi:hypothetical protein
MHNARISEVWSHDVGESGIFWPSHALISRHEHLQDRFLRTSPSSEHQKTSTIAMNHLQQHTKWMCQHLFHVKCRVALLSRSLHLRLDFWSNSWRSGVEGSNYLPERCSAAPISHKVLILPPSLSRFFSEISVPQNLPTASQKVRQSP